MGIKNGRCAISIKVDVEDVDKMMNQCRDLYIKAHPDMADIFLSKRFMFKRLVEFYLEN